MENYANTQQADIKSGMAFIATTDLVFSKTVQPT